MLTIMKYVKELLFFVLAFVLFIKDYIFEIFTFEQKIKFEDLLELKIRIKDMENKVNKIINQNEFLFFQQSFMINYQGDLNDKNKLNKENSNLRVNFLLLLLSNKMKNAIALTRIVNFRKIVTCLLNHIIDKNKKFLKKTLPKFYDILKPIDNQRAFFIIYCAADNEISKKTFNIITDFLMFIHNFTSSIIHLNNIENYQNMLPKNKKYNEEESSESNHFEKKTNISFYPNELIDYVFTSYNLEKEIKEMILTLESEEKQNIENVVNISKKKDAEEDPKVNEIDNINNKKVGIISHKYQEGIKKRI